jgi:DNA mismatch repair protein MutS2
VLVSADAGTPFALAEYDGIEALELPAVLDRVASYAAGPLGREEVLARRPSDDVAWISGELQTVAELARLVRENRGVAAEPVPEVDSALSRLRVAGSVLEGSQLLAVRRTVVASRLVVAELKRVAADAPRTALYERPLPEKGLERRLTLAFDDDGQLLDSASPTLAAARREIRAARERLVQKLDGMLRHLGGEGAVTLRDGRYVIPVARELRGRPDGIVHGESASGATLFIEPSAVIGLGNELREAELRAEREELQVYRDLTELVRPQRDTIAAIHSMCVAVDDLVARARYAAAVDGHAPVVALAPAALTIVNGRHPLLLADAAQESSADRPSAGPPVRRSVIPFDLDLDPDQRTVLISGPNTGGKSVLLKAVGLCCALAQSGIIPPVGPGSRLPVFQRIFADIGDRQSIAASLSTFSAHVAVLRRILDHADDKTLVLLDEIGSGTDPAEGAALAGAVLLSLTRRGTITLATTHLGALKELASRVPGVVNASLQFDSATLQPSYHFQKGVPGRSYGLAIARRLGLPESVLTEAEQQIPDAERNLDALLASVEERQREQARREAELEAREAQAETLRVRLESQATTQGIREAELKRKEKEAERAAREQSRSLLLEARQRVEEAIAKAREAGDEGASREARRLVEEAVRSEGEKLAAMEQAGGREGGKPEDLAIGARVRLEGGGTGHVMELRDDGKAVVSAGAVKLVVPVAKLVTLAAESRPLGPPAVPPSRPPALERSEGFEVDLRGLTGEEAEQSVLSALDAAVLAEHPYLRIIHGKGTGVVRDRVQKVVARDRRVRKHAFAPANQGGTGVTVVEFES